MEPKRRNKFTIEAKFGLIIETSFWYARLYASLKSVLGSAQRY